MTDLLPLRTYRLSPRKARVDVTGTALSLYLPTYFGQKRWDPQATDLVVSDLSSLVDRDLEEEADDAPEVFFQDEVRLPYLFTTGPATAPNMALVFRSPQRVPPLRLLTALAPNVDLPFGYRSSRSDAGVAVDGVLLRARDHAAAVARLRQAGAQVTEDPDAWLAEHRTLVTDPEEQVRILLADKKLGRLGVITTVGFFTGIVAIAATDTFSGAISGPLYAVGALALSASVAARVLTWRASRAAKAG